MSITTCSFSMMPLNDQAHELTINFEDDNHKSVGSNQFIFKKQSVDHFQEELHDVCSQNGYCSDTILLSLFKSKDLKDSQKILAAAKNHSEKAHNIFVLDIKGEKKSYLDPSISACENTVLNFFKGADAQGGSKHADKMHELFKPPNLDYIFNEGSLKSAMLKQTGFADSQIEFLQKTKEGVKDLCQIAEFILNGFKMGYEMDSFKAADYIQPVSNHPFKPHLTSVVFYPPSYTKLYNVDKPFSKTLGSCYNIEGNLDAKSKISTVIVKNLTL